MNDPHENAQSHPAQDQDVPSVRTAPAFAPPLPEISSAPSARKVTAARRAELTWLVPYDLADYTDSMKAYLSMDSWLFDESAQEKPAGVPTRRGLLASTYGEYMEFLSHRSRLYSKFPSSGEYEAAEIHRKWLENYPKEFGSMFTVDQNEKFAARQSELLSGTTMEKALPEIAVAVSQIFDQDGSVALNYATRALDHIQLGAHEKFVAMERVQDALDAYKSASRVAKRSRQP